MRHRSHETWTTGQIARMEHLIAEAKARNARVNWTPHLGELGHTIAAVRSYASKLYERYRDRREKEERQALRLIADTAPRGIEPAALPPKPKSPAPKLVVDSHRINTSTGALSFAATMRDRLEGVSITAGLFGDPPAGRSALDQRRQAARA